MNEIAKIFINGRSQAVRLPAAFRFKAKEVFIRKDQETGDVILSQKPDTWESFFMALKNTEVPSNFLDQEERNLDIQDRDPFEEWK